LIWRPFNQLRGTSRPSALAVVRLMTRSNLVGCSTGMSPGFATRRSRSTKSAARQCGCGKLGPCARSGAVPTLRASLRCDVSVRVGTKNPLAVAREGALFKPFERSTLEHAMLLLPVHEMRCAGDGEERLVLSTEIRVEVAVGCNQIVFFANHD